MLQVGILEGGMSAVAGSKRGKTDAEPTVHELRSSTFRVEDQQLLVISYPIERRDLSGLSPGESEVARLAADGLTNAEIAASRGTAVRTIANQMASILSKLRLSSRRELTAVYHGTRPKPRPSK